MRETLPSWIAWPLAAATAIDGDPVRGVREVAAAFTEYAAVFLTTVAQSGRGFDLKVEDALRAASTAPLDVDGWLALLTAHVASPTGEALGVDLRTVWGTDTT